ncbi:MAG: glycosyltransferase family 9 protein [Candidatus Jettenia sp.]|nr:MAG: glycosyltransferase family 9 protein [Candidatus Jettenia sp.]
MEETRLRYKPTSVYLPAFCSHLKKSLQGHILIVRPSALGDLIVSLPALEAIRNYFSGAHIEIMGYPSFLEIVRGRFYADTVSRFDHADIATLFMRNAQISEHLMKRFGCMDIIIPFVFDKEQILTKNLESIGARAIVHYDPFPLSGESIHITDYFIKFLDVLGIPDSGKIPKIFLHEKDILFGNDFIRDKIDNSNKKLIAIHPGSGSRQKCWPLERFAELILWMRKEMDVQILVISGPADYEIVEKLRAKVKDFIHVDQLPLPNLAAIIKQCNVFIGNDSGITHLAAAVGVHTIAIFGSTDPNVWGPRGEWVKILHKKSDCSPCFPDTRRNCFLQTCLEAVTVEDVMCEVKHFL